jgi:hypothetical protein
MRSRKIFVLAVLVCLSSALASAQHEGHGGGPPEKLGKVHFETSCKPEVRADFDRGVALLHSFWFPAAISAFQGVLAKDSSCAIAYWGIALSQWGNPFAGRSLSVAQDGLSTVAKGKAVAGTSAREKAYLEAVEKLYLDAEKLDSRARAVAYEAAMDALQRAHPKDVEARIFYALALSSNAPASDKSYAKLLKAAAILEPEWKKQPQHPGLPHYIIHAYDVPALAPRALAAARTYAKIAPSAPHALHMPSHTFTRVGSWQESIETNIASAQAARKANSPGEVLHAFDYQAYAYLQGAQDQAARKVVDELQAVLATLSKDAVYGLVGGFALAAIPARYALERSDWGEAAKLEPRQGPLGFTEAMTRFARALGAARGGNAAAARTEVERLAALRDEIAPRDPYWSELVEIQRKGAQAWALFAEGKKAEGLALLREAADQEDKTEKSAVSPGPLAPARELLGEMLLEAGKPKDALPEFLASTRKEPNRFRGVSGAARAAELAGDKAKARELYAQLLAICEKADAERPELVAARKFLGRPARKT